MNCKLGRFWGPVGSSVVSVRFLDRLGDNHEGYRSDSSALYITRTEYGVFQYSRSQWPCSLIGLRPLGCWDRGFESRSEHGCFVSCVYMLCCPV
jgi:hypothetical protein